MKKLNLNVIRLDGGTQPREQINTEVVSDYAEAVKVGIEFPPVVVFHDGADHWLADGFHRLHAHKLAGKASIEAEVRTGTLLEAKLHAVGANSSHGLRRSNEDKRRAVLMVLAQPEWKGWSDRQVATACGVSHPFVAALRRPEPAKVVTVTTSRGGEKGAASGNGYHSEVAETPAKSGNVTTSKPSAVPVSAPSAAPEQEVDQLAELEAAHAEITKLTSEIQTAEADDLKAEAIKWRRSYEHAMRQQSEAMDRAKKATDREAWTMKQLRRCGKAVGQDDPTKVASDVEKFVRAHHKEAA